MMKRAGMGVKGSGRAGSQGGRARAAQAALLAAAVAGLLSCSSILGIDHDYIEGASGAGGAGGSPVGTPASASSSGSPASSSGNFVSSSSSGVIGTGGAGGVSGAGGAGGVSGPPVCGDGALDAGEQCDDSNTQAGDGCSPTCTIEVVDQCPGAQVSLDPGTLSLSGSTAGATDDSDGSCTGANSPDVVYAVTPTATGTLDLTMNNTFQGVALYVRDVCGSNAVSAERACDVLFLGGGAIDLWVEAGSTYYVIVDGAFGSSGKFTLNLKLTVCGDGKVDGLEQCDDANGNSNDGCAGCVSCSGASETSDPTTHHCYRTGAGASAWAAARQDCIAWGGDLVALSTQSELGAFTMLCANGDQWTGGNDIAAEGTYTYTNGEPWAPFWGPAEPNGLAGDDCVKVSCLAGALADTTCSTMLPYVCERAPAQ